MLGEGDDTFLAEIDGNDCTTVRSFLIQIGVAFQFPKYYGENINAFWDCIGDLSWLDKKNYSLVINNSASFLMNENSKTREDIINLLQQVAIDWANVPNFEGEDTLRLKADFKIIYR